MLLAKLELKISWTMGVFQYDYVKLPPERQIGIHSQRTWELNYILKGSGMHTIGEIRAPFRDGEIVLVPPEVPHCWNFDSVCTDSSGDIANITILFDDSLLDAVLLAFPDMRECIGRMMDRRESAIYYYGRTLRELGEVMSAMRDEDAALRAASFLRVLVLLGRDSDARLSDCLKISSEERRKMKIRTFISCNCLRSITLKEIASYVGMNEAAFCVFFKRVFGQTFVQYLNAQRLEYARYLLEKGNMSITEVCYASGFVSPPYFSRLFRRTLGMSPQQYANLHAPGE